MTQPCPACGVSNRIPPARLAQSARCGACHNPLPPPTRPIDVDSALFDQIASGAKTPILVDFFADWCGPCKAAAPEVEKVAGEMAGRALVLKVDTERNPELAARFGVRSIPTFVVLRGGKALLQKAGAVSRAEMRKWLEAAMS